MNSNLCYDKFKKRRHLWNIVCSDAFKGKHIRNVKFPSSLRKIETNAFEGNDFVSTFPHVSTFRIDNPHGIVFLINFLHSLATNFKGKVILNEKEIPEFLRLTIANILRKNEVEYEKKPSTAQYDIVDPTQKQKKKITRDTFCIHDGVLVGDV